MPGDAIAVLYIPRLGSDYRRVVLEGTAGDRELFDRLLDGVGFADLEG